MRISPLDLLLLGVAGVTARLMRAALSVLGIAIGVTTLVVVTGIPASAQQALLDEMTRLGTDLLVATVRPTQGEAAPMLLDGVAMVDRIGPVTAASAVANTQTSVRRTDLTEESVGVGVAVLAARDNLLGVINAQLAEGRFLDSASDAYPTVVLGAQAARWLGIPRLPVGTTTAQVLVGDRWFTVRGILRPAPLAPSIDQAVLVGWPAAQTYLDFDGHPTVVYLKAREDSLEDVRQVLPATLNPQLPDLIQVSRPSDALLAKRQTQTTYSSLFVGLAGVSLLVGGIGVANTMVISVLERRREIGLRRSLGATRGHIRAQFLTEAVLLSCAGGLLGVCIGTAATIAYAISRGWPAIIPVQAIWLGLTGSIAVGAAAGLYPSMRAAHLAPTEALASS